MDESFPTLDDRVEFPHCNPRIEGWRNAMGSVQPIVRGGDPLVLDLNRDGKINLDNATFFDLNANGFHEFTRWISETDAFLVLDANANGIIDDGSEMFGDSMRLPDGSIALSGFEALRAYDSNSDGKIDLNDEIFASLKLFTGAGQLVTLADAGVKSITLPPYSPLPNDNTSNLPRDERIRRDYALWLAGGATPAQATFEWEDGTEGLVAEVLPYRIPMYSIPAATWEVPEDIAALPNLYGRGILYDLQQIMAIDESGDLRGILEEYMSEKDQAKEGMLSQLLYKWAGVDEIDPRSMGVLIDARMIAFLEAYFGEPFIGADVTSGFSTMYHFSNFRGNGITLPNIQLGSNPNGIAANQLRDLFSLIVREMDAALLVQTHLKPFFDQADVDITEPVFDEENNLVERGTIRISFDSAIEWLGELAVSNTGAVVEHVRDLKRLFETSDMIIAEQLRVEGIYNDVLNIWENLPSQGAKVEWGLFKNGYENVIASQNVVLSSIYQNINSNIIWGTDNQVAIDGTKTNDLIIGTTGNNNLYGGAGSDILIGGAGDDYLEGGAGKDTYLWGPGDGNDTINDYAAYKHNNGLSGILKIGQGVDPANIEITRSGNNLILIIGETGERLTIQGWYISGDYQLEKIVFGNGTVWTKADINAMRPVFHVTDEEGETITGTASGDIIYGGNGNDALYCGGKEYKSIERKP